MRRGGHRGAGISAQLVGVPLITKRLVFQVGGYDPMSPEAAYRRFNRELRRFETTWGVTARTTEAEVTPDEVRWRVVTRGPDWAVETVYHLVRWDDVIESDWKRSDWQRIPSGLLAFADFLWNGAFVGYLRSNWRYAGFFLYPYVLLAAMVIVAFVGGIAAGNLSSSALVGAALTAALFVGLLQWPGRRLFVSTFWMTGSSLAATSTVRMQFSDRASTGSRNGYARLRGPAKLMRSSYLDTASVPCSRSTCSTGRFALSRGSARKVPLWPLSQSDHPFRKLGCTEPRHGFERRSSGSRTRVPSSGASTKRSQM